MGESNGRMEEEKFRKKILWFNFVCCLLVIWNHAGNADLFFGAQAAEHFLYHFEYEWMAALIRVNIPCFMMISGYLFFRNFQWESLPDKWKRRVKTLLIPYLLWNLLYYAGYYTASQFEQLRPLINRPELTFTLKNLWNAAVHFAFNPVFWFMYQLILLVLLAPWHYLILKRKWTGIPYLGLLWYGIYRQTALPQLNLDALLYYSTAAFLAIHGKEVIEGAWNQRRGLFGVVLLAGGYLCGWRFYHTFFIPEVVLYHVLVAGGFWFLVSEDWLGRVRPFMTTTFFIYALHFIPTRLVNKVGAMLFPGNGAAAALLYLLMPAVIVILCNQAARFLRRYTPRLWMLLNGGR